LHHARDIVFSGVNLLQSQFFRAVLAGIDKGRTCGRCAARAHGLVDVNGTL